MESVRDNSPDSKPDREPNREVPFRNDRIHTCVLTEKCGLKIPEVTVISQATSTRKSPTSCGLIVANLNHW
jgi:hypothetical protein